jgi:FtsH-binding integral membrane protein
MQSRTLPSYTPVAESSAEIRSNFIWRTYGHVAAAILLFAGLETYLFDSGLAGPMVESMLGFNWLLILGAFMLVGWLATHVAHAVLYDTSNILHHYPEDRYVAAALQLFASVALMFWYVLRLFMSRD